MINLPNLNNITLRIFKFLENADCDGSYIGAKYIVSNDKPTIGDLVEINFINEINKKRSFLCFIDKDKKLKPLINIYTPVIDVLAPTGPSELPLYYYVNGSIEEDQPNFYLPGQPRLSYHNMNVHTVENVKDWKKALSRRKEKCNNLFEQILKQTSK